MSILPRPLHSEFDDRSAKVVLGVWMRDLLGGRDDFQGLRESVWIGRLGAPVGKFRLGGQVAADNLVR